MKYLVAFALFVLIALGPMEALMSWPEAFTVAVAVICITVVLLTLLLGEDLVDIIREIRSSTTRGDKNTKDQTG